jgi:outer membrane protein assembly factor BamA
MGKGLKRIGVNFVITLFLIFIAGQVRAEVVQLEEYSENYRISIGNIKISGNKILSQKEIFDTAGITAGKSPLVGDILKGIQELKNSGYFSKVSYQFNHDSNGNTLLLFVSENPTIASIKFVDIKFLDMTVFNKKMAKYNVLSGRVFSKVRLEKAIEEFTKDNQNKGIFLFMVNYRVMTSEEIKREKNFKLFDPAEISIPGIHIIVYFRNIRQMTISNIYMKGFSCEYDDLINYLMLNEGMTINSDDELFFRYKRLKRLGFFDSVYFQNEPIDEQKYKIVIEGKEAPVSDINTSITAPPNIGVIMTAEYFNISLFNTLQRVRAAIGWETQVQAPVFTLEYTHPYFWHALFFDVTFSKNDQADPIKDQLLYKYSRNYEGKVTVGTNIYHNLSSYIVHTEEYAISETVDMQFKRREEYARTKNLLNSTGIMAVYDNVDDNFFITQGYKIVGRCDAYWKDPIAYKVQFSGEAYLPISPANIIMAFTNRSNFLFTSSRDTTTTLTLDPRMRSNVQEIYDIENQQVKFTTYFSPELRFPMPDINEILRAISFIIFFEAGGAWSDYQKSRLDQTGYGFGCGFRLSPRKYYSTYLFQFPAGMYVGYRIGGDKVRPSLISHRDDLYYINLSASF